MNEVKGKQRSRVLFKAGLVALFVAGLFWILAIVTPFLALSVAEKAGVITFALVAGEIAFWIGALLTGKEFIERFKRYLKPDNWRKNKDRD